MPKIVACGGRQSAYEDFKTAQDRHQNAGGVRPMLLVDAEAPVTTGNSWQHLQHCDSWPRPTDAADDQCYLMVQVMESWFLADRQALIRFYGQDFHDAALPANPDVEQVSKRDVLKKLDHASRDTKKMGYDKGSHSFEILGRLDPQKVAQASPFAMRFLDALHAVTQA